MVILQLYEKIKVEVDWDNKVNHPPFRGGGGHLKKVNWQTAEECFMYKMGLRPDMNEKESFKW